MELRKGKSGDDEEEHEEEEHEFYLVTHIKNIQ